jgi:methylthioribose-1-phosphate isomerase
MDRGEVNTVVVGSDRCAQNGDVINKVGTYPLALMAKQYGVPFHVLVQDPGSLVRGEDVTIEERSATELLEFQGRPLVAKPRQTCLSLSGVRYDSCFFDQLLGWF